MRYLSVCSGIEAATVAWHSLGWEAVAFAEIDAFPCAVLAHHYPGVPNLGDFTKIEARDVGAVDLIVGGTPCQDFSVAGLRAGLGGERGRLTVEFLRLLDRVRPRWVVWENVPGVLSADDGRAFGAFLGGLAELGYGWAYRILDAKFFGVPQRRRRVFVVGCLGDERRAAAVLFERASLSGHPAPRREAGSIAAALTRDGLGGGGADDNLAQGNHLVANTLAAYSQIEQNYVAHALRAEGFDASEGGTGRRAPLVPVAFGAQVESPFLEDVALPVTARNGDAGMVAFSCKDHGADAGEIAPTLRAMEHDGSHANAGGQIAVVLPGEHYASPPKTDARRGASPRRELAEQLARELRAAVPVLSFARASSVRRLTPRECERLQGFPDDFTLVPYRGKPAADGPRYRALGNSMAVPCMVWLGRRFQIAAGNEGAA